MTTVSLGDKIGPFRITKLLGIGGMGEVYEARDEDLNRDVAIKILSPVLSTDPTAAERFRRFQQEAQLLAQLNDPHIIQVYAASFQENLSWIAMQLAPERSLDKVNRNQLAFAVALTILRGVARALDAAHAREIVHRDVKPENIFLGPNFHSYLGDFGLAQLMGAPGLTKEGIIVGTPHYMAPEQIEDDPLDGRCDVYALGIVAYELLVGRKPFDGPNRASILLKHLTGAMPEDGVPRNVVPVLRKCLAKRRDERYNTAGEFLSSLETGLTATEEQQRPTLPPVITPPPRRRPSSTLAFVPAGGPDQEIRREARLIHLAHLNIPRYFKRGWERCWRRTAQEIMTYAPDVVVFTGNLLASHRQVERLRWFFSELYPATLGDIPRVIVPSAEERALFRDLGQLTQEFPGLQDGWQQPIAGTLHIYSVNSMEPAWFDFQKRRDYRSAAIPIGCRTQHLHLFAIHHHAGEYEQAVSTEDADGLLRQLAGFGYDIVLYGDRTPTEGPRVPEQRHGGLWLIAGAVFGKHVTAFNLITGSGDGDFHARIIRCTPKGTLAQTVIQRDYEEARNRRWRAQRRMGLACEVLDIQIAPYVRDAADANDPHQACGDIMVTITIQNPELATDHLPLPLSRIAGYAATAWRDVRAVILETEERLKIHDDDGTIRVTPHDSRTIRVTGVLLNALPVMPDDWSRMQASQPDLQYLFRIEPTLAANFLHVRVACPYLGDLYPVRPENPWEVSFYTPHPDTTDQYDLTVFRPLIGKSYALSVIGDEPVPSAEPTPSEAAAWPRAVASLREEKLASAFDEVQEALTMLRQTVVRLIATAHPSNRGDDVSIDLLSVDGPLTVIMNDRRTERRIGNKQAPRSVGISFAWGQGLAGRALRLMREYGWSRADHPGHPNTWPVHEWYFRHPEIKKHRHVYCQPVAMRFGNREYAIALLSFATHDVNSGLGTILQSLRDRRGTNTVKDECDTAVKRFATTLRDELARYQDDTTAGDINEGNDEH